MKTILLKLLICFDRAKNYNPLKDYLEYQIKADITIVCWRDRYNIEIQLDILKHLLVLYAMGCSF
jgi:hypothetical protein